jgi:hypothetical protein
MKKLFALPMAFALFLALGFGSAEAQVATAPRLYVELQTEGVTSVVNSGAQDVTLANVRLDATQSSEDIRINGLPLTLATASGAVSSNLSGCRAFNAGNQSNALNSGNNVSGSLNGGLNNLNFDTSLIVPRGTVVSVLVQCDVSSSLPAGGTFQFSMNTSNVSATGATTGLNALVGVGRAPVGGVVTNPNPNVPGIPNTGAGGNVATNVLLLVGSVVFAGLGLVYAKKFAR